MLKKGELLAAWFGPQPTAFSGFQEWFSAGLCTDTGETGNAGQSVGSAAGVFVGRITTPWNLKTAVKPGPRFASSSHITPTSVIDC